MSNPNATPHTASPQSQFTGGVLGRLTITILAWLAGGAIVVTSLPAILTPLPMARLLPPPPHVIARTPAEVRP
jgi:hypothetical protein